MLSDRVLVKIKVNLPRPRSPAMALEPDFIALKRRIIGLLHGEMDEDH